MEIYYVDDQEFETFINKMKERVSKGDIKWLKDTYNELKENYRVIIKVKKYRNQYTIFFKGSYTILRAGILYRKKYMIIGKDVVI